MPQLLIRRNQTKLHLLRRLPPNFGPLACTAVDLKFWKQSRFSENMHKKQEGFQPTLFSTLGLVLHGLRIGWRRFCWLRRFLNRDFVYAIGQYLD